MGVRQTGSVRQLYRGREVDVYKVRIRKTVRDADRHSVGIRQTGSVRQLYRNW